MQETEFQAWTTKAVENRVIEAAETLMLCPRAHGPADIRNSMPDTILEQHAAYGASRPRYRRTPTPGALDRMEKCWEWINALPDQAERELLYEWARIKCGKGCTLATLAKINGYTERGLRRKITHICAEISLRLNAAHVANTELASKQWAEDRTPVRLNEHKRLNHWMQENAKPAVDAELPKRRSVQRI
ncbi:hypothetical protein K1W69_07615 [Hoeflea sp. WL0058]|uniref:DUF6362 domain-containing protein n=1 Tax=Flavimaribacter sediminis TaxID=2865987 RepID=A0AAE2ZP70_9HYPH|nr:DUF6362 family protein [Flavimaribacter sediminis]MBW8637052.1 hypothetical protein [Flavimaribacter sediminis]